jgi:hypothetical protein
MICPEEYQRSWVLMGVNSGDVKPGAEGPGFQGMDKDEMIDKYCDAIK